METLKHDLLTVIAIVAVITLVAFSGIQEVCAIAASYVPARAVDNR